MVKYRLFTPGPIEVDEDVLAECGKVFPYHRDRSFAEVVEKTTGHMQEILATKARIFFFTSSGTGAMEASVVNLLSEGDEVLIPSIGKFGERWREIAETYRLKVHFLPFPYGDSVDPEQVDEHLKNNPQVKAVLATFAETSTGALNDAKVMGQIIRAHDKLFVLDSIAGLGADELYMDSWNVDVAIGSTQKAICAPPGLSLVAVGDRAWEAAKHSTLPKYYFNMQIAEKFREKGFTPWTPSILVMMALSRSLEKITDKGVKEVWADHERWASLFRKKMGDMGFNFLAKKPTNALSTILMPEGVESTPVIAEIRDKEGILFANGQQELKGRLIRFGHMGHANEADTLKAIDVLEKHALPRIKEVK
ncbi:alanine--glyoxylate aminotransferase family protein [candidate division WOR-3 bacterium]|nr:alanine--glyoxylate aminotransferase family protein [candidate division WOR-3 bacterium]